MPPLLRIPLAIVGLLFITAALWLRRMNRHAFAWAYVEGEIVKSRLEGGWQECPLSALISYRFTVQGQDYESSQFSFKVKPVSPRDERRLLETYPVGRKVQVYYDPANPKRAVVERGESSGWSFLAAFGACLVTFAVLVP